MTSRKMWNLLDTFDHNDLFHIFIPSWRRPNFVTARLFKGWTPEALEKIHIVVRPDQRRAYEEANPNLHILPIPEDYEINGLASTRQFIYEYAVDHRLSKIVDMDDDIKSLAFLYLGYSKTKGKKQSNHSGQADLVFDPNLNQKIMQLACVLAKDMFTNYPEVLLSGMRRQRLCHAPNNHAIKYTINSGSTPRQVTFMNVLGLYKANINRDVEAFDRHGDDLGFCAVILNHGFSLGSISCLVYDYMSEKCDSVIRTPETEKELHRYEWEQLQEYPIRDYLRTAFKDADGDYMWGDIDWAAYHRLNDSKRINVFWPEEKPEFFYIKGRSTAE